MHGQMRTRVPALFLQGLASRCDGLELAGPGAIAALERICPLDLHDSAFPVGAAGRTTMEHMSAVIIRTGPDTFLLLSASSSGMSFLHALETSLAYTSNLN